MLAFRNSIALLLVAILFSFNPSWATQADTADDDVLDFIIPILATANPLAIKAALWEQHAPLCQPLIDGSLIAPYPTKGDWGLGWGCNDGDMTLFNGLLCASGEQRGCDAVKRAQSSDGRFWRSPGRALTNNWNQGDSGQSSFSPDMDLGVQLYVATTKDTLALKNWLHWIEENRPCAVCQIGNPNCSVNSGCMIKGYPRYCFNSDCTLRPQDAVILTETAHHFGIESGDGIDHVPHISSASNLILAASVVNEPGYSRHLVAAQILLMRLLGSGEPTKLNSAASILAGKEPLNPFFAYLNKGATDSVRDLTFKLCPASVSDISNLPLGEWAWERTDSEIAWKKSMLWDCIFMANLLKNKP